MFKKALSLLLAVMLIITSFSVAMISVAAAGDNGAVASGEGITVTADSNFFPQTVKTVTEEELDANDGYLTVTYFIQSDQKMINSDWLLTYDGTVLEFDENKNQTIMPSASDAVVNTNPSSVEYGVRGNCTRLDGYYLDDEQGDRTAFVTATFKVIGEGDTTVTLTVYDLRVTTADEESTVDDETQLIEDGVVADGAEDVAATSTEVYAGEYDDDYQEPTTEQSTTDASTTEQSTTEGSATEQPTTDAPVAENYMIVAGQPADIFGTAWDAANESNLMDANQDGTFTKTYSVDKAYESVQLKGVLNGATWYGDATGNNVTFNITGEGEFTVTATPVDDGYVLSVSGDVVEFITAFDYETVYAVGNGEGTWLNGASWDPSYVENEMAEVADDVWEIEFTNVPEGFDRQIKFAIDGTWTHNFGGAFEDSGVTSVADYNGDNITFDTDEGVTVKAQLDLRDFDFTTKEGAKFTITISDGEEEGTTEQPTTEPAPGEGFTVIATSNLFPRTSQTITDFSSYENEAGEAFIEVEYKLNGENMSLINVQNELTWDNTVLEYKEAYNTVDGQLNFYPFAVSQNKGTGVVNTFGDTNNGRIVANYTKIDSPAYAYEEDGSPVTVVKAVFKIIDRTAGETTVNCNVNNLSLDDDNAEQPGNNYSVVVDGTPGADADKATYDTVINGAQVEPQHTTEASTTEEPTTEAPGATLTVTGTSNYCPAVDAQTVKPGDTVTVTFTAPEDADIVDIQWGMNYDKDKLELTGISTFDGGTMLINTSATTFNVLGSLSDINNPYPVTAGDDFITFVFTAKAEGETAVELTVIDMTVREGEEDEVIIADTVDQREEPQPTTEPSTTEAPAGDLTVTGSSNYSPAVEAQTVTTGNTVTVTFVAPETADIVDIQWGMNYDKDKLQLTGISTFDGGPMLINTAAETYNVLGSLSDINNPYHVTAGDALVTFVFTAKAEGTTDVQFNVIDLTVRENEKDTIIIKDGVDQREEPQQPTTEAPTTEEPTTEEPTTEEPTTEAATTEEPTTEAPATEEPTTEAPTTEEPTTEAPATEEPTTEAPATEEPTTEAPATEEPTTEEPTTEAPVTEEPTTEEPATEESTAEATAATSSTDATSATSSSSTSDSGNGGSSSGNGAVQTGNASMAIIILLVLVSATAGIYFARKREK